MTMTLAFVFVECVKDLTSSAERAVKQVQGVLEAHTIKNAGEYDLLVTVKTEDEKQFKTTIMSLKRIAGIAAIAVSIVYGNTQ